MKFPIHSMAVVLSLLIAGLMAGPNSISPLALADDKPAESPSKKQTKKEKREEKDAEKAKKQQAEQEKKAAKEAEQAEKLKAESLAKEQEAKELAAIAEKAKQQQQEWAKKLKVPVETKSKSAIELVLIPPGGEALPEPYWIGKYEVTQAEWKLAKWNVDLPPRKWSASDAEGKVTEWKWELTAPSKFQAEFETVKGLDTTRFPVEMVEWIHCVYFCNSLSELEGLQPYYGLKICKGNVDKEIGSLQDGVWHRAAEITILGGNGYHLPTNAQWEHACRAGTTTRYHFGSSAENAGEFAWYHKNSDNRPHPVGEKKPNAFGLYDMAGNVRELTEELQEKTIEIEGRPVKRNFNQSRGGSHGAPISDCESAMLSELVEWGSHWTIGLRLAREATPQKRIAPTAFDERLYYKLQFVPGKKVLGITGANDENARVILAPSNDNQGQQWKFVKAGDYYKIVNRKSGKALNVANASGEENAEIIQWDAANFGENQQWSLVPQGEHFLIKARHSGLVLDTDEDSDKRKASVVQAKVREGRHQTVELVPVKE